MSDEQEGTALEHVSVWNMWRNSADGTYGEILSKARTMHVRHIQYYATSSVLKPRISYIPASTQPMVYAYSMPYAEIVKP